MPYAQRDDQGRIVGLFAVPQPELGATEEVPDDAELYSPPVREWLSTDFLERFTFDEWQGIFNVSKTAPLIDRFKFLAVASPIIHAIDPRVQQALGYLVSLGLISPERKAEILNE